MPVSPFLGKALMRYLIVRDSYFDERKIPEPYVFVSYRGYKMVNWFNNTFPQYGEQAELNDDGEVIVQSADELVAKAVT